MALSRRHAWRALLTIVPLVLFGCGAHEKYPQTTYQPVTEFGRLLNSLFMNTFWWTMGILVIVELILLWFVFRYREQPGAPEPQHIHGHTWLEIGWTLVPSIIVLFIAVPTIQGVFTTQSKAPADALVVEVIGHQWWWEFRYPEYGVATANELVLPVGRHVDLQMHSADVVHSFWVPRVGGKRDVNPQPRTVKAERARVNHINFNIEQPGYYAGQCAEFCGESHALMRTAIVAMSASEFGQWVTSMGGRPMVNTPAAGQAQMGAATAEKVPPKRAPGEREGGSLGMPSDTLTVADTMTTTAPASLPAQTQTGAAAINPLSPTGAPAPGRGVAQSAGPLPLGSAQMSALMPGQPSIEQRGQQLFTTRVCVACHTVNGTTAKGTIGPNLTRFGMRRTVGAGTRPATLENVEAWIRDPKSMKPGALMPGAQEGAGGMPATGLNNDEIKAIAAYLKSLK